MAECRARLVFDEETRIMVWNLFKEAPTPVGYDPTIIPGWDKPTSDSFVAMKLEPWRLRVFPGTALTGEGRILTWMEG